MESKLKIVEIFIIGFALAGLLGYLAMRIRLPTILGYLIAGNINGQPPPSEKDLASHPSIQNIIKDYQNYKDRWASVMSRINANHLRISWTNSSQLCSKTCAWKDRKS